MDAPVRANLSTAQKYTKTSKIGEGTYAVVYSGMHQICRKWSQMRRVLSTFTGQEIATGRKVAIKKIKVGGFKDGLDMSAIREVKFLQELHHPNILEVSPVSVFGNFGPPNNRTRLAVGCLLNENESQSRFGVSRYRSGNCDQRPLHLLSSC